MTDTPDTCAKCGGLLREGDEIATGWNGHLSDVGTGRTIILCESCGEVCDD
jgi:hypothetical protein